jgi:subtilase family serine protease
MTRHWKAMAAVGALLGGLLTATGAVATPSNSGGSGPGAGYSPPLPPEAPACGAPSSGVAMCHAIQLEYPSQYWHPGPSERGSGVDSSATSLPSRGYYPGDLLNAYGLATAAGAVPVGSGPTVAVVDAYDDSHAASDLASYRSVLTGATDSYTGLSDPTIPPLCSSTVGTSGCVTFTKVNQSGGTNYPRGNTGWAEEISLDLDMISAICPNCNITLVEASTNSFSNLEAAVSYAKSLHPAAVTNSYGGSEFSSESQADSYYSASGSTAMTAATGDSGYGVEYPAASPGLTAVGGTSLTYAGSPLDWKPQSVWSNSTSSGAGSGCSAYEPMPSWQNLSGVYDLPADCAPTSSSGREVGDVSAVADPVTGVAVYDTYNEPGWLVFGGTSASTQIIGAVYALAAADGGSAASPSVLYTDTTSSGGPTPGLTPVLSGSNASCGNYLCLAGGTGLLNSDYNGPTGLGTPAGVSAFQGSSTTSSPDFSLSASPSSQTVTQGSSTAYTVTMSSSGGYTGSVTLTVNDVPSGATATFSTNPVTSPSPSWTLTVATSSATTTGSVTLTITGSDGTLTHTTTVGLTVSSPRRHGH